MAEEIKKNVDESWKNEAKSDKEKIAKQPEEFAPPEPDFSFFVTTLSLQASIALGIIPNPGTNQKEESLTQAKFIIDTLSMLKDKTTGNLNAEEDNLLENVLYELRMTYVSKTKGEVK
ncbi:MAG: DUF1844 domain-containing protein [Candidatus Omnitrophica bacterium]|nr:DUF1844 domain-containing protein [Candidatus Omnitrophota bacterium]